MVRARRPRTWEHAADVHIPPPFHARIMRDAEPEWHHLMTGLRSALLLLLPALVAIVLDYRMRHR